MGVHGIEGEIQALRVVLRAVIAAGFRHEGFVRDLQAQAQLARDAVIDVALEESFFEQFDDVVAQMLEAARPTGEPKR